MANILSSPDGSTARQPLILCHYGAGEYEKSPVVIETPRVLCPEGPMRLPAPLYFAEALQEAYELCDTSEDYARLAGEIAACTRAWRRGNHHFLRLTLRDYYSYWLRTNRVSHRDYPLPTVREAAMDELDRLASLKVIEQPTHFGLESEGAWPTRVAIFTQARALRALAAFVLASTWITGVSMLGRPDLAVLALPALFFLRPTIRVEDHTDISYYQYSAVAALPGTPADRAALGREVARGLSDEDLYARVASAILAEAEAKEVEALREEVASELEAQCFKTFEGEGAKKEPLLDLLFNGEITETRDTQVLEAQTELLRELRLTRSLQEL